MTDGRDIQGEFAIPPLDWESYDDGRYDPPSVELEITSTGDDNARWRADAAWAAENGVEGSSQVDAYEKDGLTASGTATFANAWDIGRGTAIRRETAAVGGRGAAGERFPNVSSGLASALFAGSPDERFEAGLTMLLDGIQKRLQPARPARHR